MWNPTIPKARPLYRGIVLALESDIASGRLTAGERLPTHRELAHALNITTGTVTKAYTSGGRSSPACSASPPV